VSPRYLTPKEVSDWLGVPVETLKLMRSRPGKDPLPFIKVGRFVRYPEDKIREWAERNTFYDTQEAKRHRSA